MGCLLPCDEQQVNRVNIINLSGDANCANIACRVWATTQEDEDGVWITKNMNFIKFADIIAVEYEYYYQIAINRFAGR